MNGKESIEKLCRSYGAFIEKVEILKEKGIKGIDNDILIEMKNILGDVRDNIQNENDWENNYLIIRLKKETSIGYHAMKKLKDIGLIKFDDGEHFDFQCENIGVIGSFFAYVKFKKSKMLSEYITHKGKTVKPITFTNGGKISPTKEWDTIENILDTMNLTRK